MYEKCFDLNDFSAQKTKRNRFFSPRFSARFLCSMKNAFMFIHFDKIFQSRTTFWMIDWLIDWLIDWFVLSFDSLGSRTLSARDYLSTPSYYSTPIRPFTGTLERRKSRTNTAASDYDDTEFDLQSEYRKIDEIYEREREKRQRSQAVEEDKRRHNYVPTLTRSPVPGDRYDSVYDDPFSCRPGRPRSVSPGVALGLGRRDRARSTSSQGEYMDSALVGPARALYNFTAQNPR